MEQITYFATFGSGQLQNFDVRPMGIMVFMEGATEEELRQRLRGEPFNNNYFTTYPISRAKDMIKDFSMYLISMDGLLARYKG